MDAEKQPPLKLPVARLEISVYSLESARVSEAGGADRLELCAGFAEGGTTPSPGLFRAVRAAVSVPVHVIVRPRGGDFVLVPEETEILAADITLFRELGADGFVFGALDPDGNVDAAACPRLLAAADGRPCVFHRAFDLARDPHEAFAAIIALGFSGLLSSGQAAQAPQGSALLADLVRLAPPGFEVIPGCGLSPANLAALHAAVRAPVYHASATTWHDSPMGFRRAGVFMNQETAALEYRRQGVNPEAVKAMKTILAQA